MTNYKILERAAANLALIDKLDVIGRTSELARVFGIDFFSVLSRGSQVLLLALSHLSFVKFYYFIVSC